MSKSVVSSGSVLRRNIITGNWVVFAMSRKGRPNQYRELESQAKLMKETDPAAVAPRLTCSKVCPFCPGNEDQLNIVHTSSWPEATARSVSSVTEDPFLTHVDPASGISDRQPPKWMTRDIMNKYPAVSTHKTATTPSALGQEGDEEHAEAGYSEQSTSVKLMDKKSSSRAWAGSPYCTELPAIGHHEVVIESPFHNYRVERDLLNLPRAAAHLHGVLSMWHRRGLFYYQQNSAENQDKFRQEAREGGANSCGGEGVTPDLIKQVLFFKNCGPNAGASVVHPHSQIVALPIVPSNISERLRVCIEFYKERGVSPFEHVLSEEEELLGTSQGLRGGSGEERTNIPDGSRVISVSENFVAFVPFAALGPLNITIVPSHHHLQGCNTGTRVLSGGKSQYNHRAHFELEPEEMLPELSKITARCLQSLWSALRESHPIKKAGGLEYNMVLRSAPFNDRAPHNAYNTSAYFTWHLEILPRLGAGAMAGFELGSGMFSNGNWPEEDAALLREHLPEIVLKK